MRFIFSVVLLACTFLRASEIDKLLDQVHSCQKNGDFAKAEQLVHDYIDSSKNIPAETRSTLLFEIERDKRIKRDYRLSEEKLLNRLKNSLQDFDESEFQKWQKEGRFDFLMIDGRKRFVNASFSNLFFRFPELKKRKKDYTTIDQTAREYYDHVQLLKKAAAGSPESVFLPRNVFVRQSITLEKGKVPIGDTVRCWLPYPSVFQTQGNVQFSKASQPVRWIASPQAKIRSVYMEGISSETPLTFQIEYTYTAWSFYKPIDPSLVQPFDGSEPEYVLYTKEEKPHEVFSDEMRKLAMEIVGKEANPYLKGRKIYDWICKNIKYSYAREYSTLPNISAYCLENKYGDCGQETILFITLCRISGVPARWQSGFFTSPTQTGMHDWAEIFIKPYGWLPVDPYMGIFWTSMHEDLTADQREEMRKFYYGNIDHFRLVANKSHNQKLYPVKKFYRSETVDFQRGELEWKGGNLYFNDWDWDMDISPLSNSDL